MFGFGRLGPMELLLILVAVLLIFGPKRLPGIGRSLGKAIREFREHSRKLTEDFDLKEEFDSDKDAPPSDSKRSSYPEEDERSKERDD